MFVTLVVSFALLWILTEQGQDGIWLDLAGFGFVGSAALAVANLLYLQIVHRRRATVVETGGASLKSLLSGLAWSGWILLSVLVLAVLVFAVF